MKAVMGAVTILAALAAGPAYAENLETRVVNARDLDLSTQRGVQRFERRIVNAARDICQPEATTGSRILSPEAQLCVSEIVAKSRKRAAALVAKRTKV